MTTQHASLRLGVIGAGAHAQENLYPAIALDRRLTLGTICTRSQSTAEPAAQMWGAETWTTSLDEVFERCDAVVASGPPELHEAAIREATSRRVPLFVEKPPARSAAALIAATAGDLDAAPVFVDFNMRFAAAHISAFDSVDADEPQLMSVRMISRKPLAPMWSCHDLVETYLLAVGIHAVEMVTSRFGAPTSVTSHVVRLSTERFALVATLKFGEDRVGVLDLGNSSNTFESSIALSTADRTISVDNLTTRSVRSIDVADKSAVVTQLGGLAGGYERSGYSTALDRFVTMAVTGGPNPSGLAGARTALEVIDTILRHSHRR